MYKQLFMKSYLGLYIICNQATHFLSGWIDVQQTRTSITPLSQLTTDTKQSKHVVGRLKCNIDASFTNNKVGIGAQIRNDEDLFVIGRTEWFSLVLMLTFVKPQVSCLLSNRCLILVMITRFSSKMLQIFRIVTSLKNKRLKFWSYFLRM